MPLKELERLKAVNRFLRIDFSKEKELQEIVDLAAVICNTPTALITLLDHDTQHIKFKTGFNQLTTGREEAFCNYVLGTQEVLMVPDARLDERFIRNPLVIGDPNIRFYAGSPLNTSDGHTLGSLCVIDQYPKELTGMQLQMLEVLSRQVIQLLEFDVSLNVLKEQLMKAKDTEIKLRSFFESSNGCHLLLDKNLEVLAFNKASSEFIEKHYQGKLKIGTLVTDFIHHEHLPTFIINCNAAISGFPVELEIPLTYANGQRYWWAISYEPAYNPDGEIIGVSYNATDITRRIEQEQKVWAQNESLRHIAYIQSHEIRRPVASILGLVNVFEAEDFKATRSELLMLKEAAQELDEKIRRIVGHAD
jgi:PAS domain-containing protein